MIRGLWLSLPLLLILAADAALTLLGQPPAYAQGTLQAAREAHPVLLWLLQQGERAFLLGMAAGAGMTLLLAALLPGLLGQMAFAVTGLWHAFRVCTRLQAQAPALLRDLGKRLGGFPEELLSGWAASPSAGLGAALAWVALLCLLTLLCWRWGGLLACPAPAQKPPAKPKKKEG